jgi:hypothetical protein
MPSGGGGAASVGAEKRLDVGDVARDHCRTLSRYNRWMNEKVYTVASKLTDEERNRDRGAAEDALPHEYVT